MIDSYKFYASDYDVGTTTNIAATTDLIKRSVKKYNPDATTMLELASGTGNVIERLMHDFDMTGIDLSPAMIEVAQKKLPNIEMHVADMTSFKLNKKYDVIICVFDSVNHLATFEDWESLFDRVAEHLSESGVFYHGLQYNC